MTKTYQFVMEEKLHKQIKTNAALFGISIGQYIEIMANAYDRTNADIKRNMIRKMMTEADHE